MSQPLNFSQNIENSKAQDFNSINQNNNPFNNNINLYPQGFNNSIYNNKIITRFDSTEIFNNELDRNQFLRKINDNQQYQNYERPPQPQNFYNNQRFQNHQQYLPYQLNNQNQNQNRNFYQNQNDNFNNNNFMFNDNNFNHQSQINNYNQNYRFDIRNQQQNNPRKPILNSNENAQNSYFYRNQKMNINQEPILMNIKETMNLKDNLIINHQKENHGEKFSENKKPVQIQKDNGPVLGEKKISKENQNLAAEL